MNSINPINNNNSPAFKRGNESLANFITKMTKADAMAPVIALEATVVAGRTYHAYKRGKWDEARERFIEETMGSITWLGGVWALNKLGDKILDKILKINGRSFDVGTDKVLRTPFENFIKSLQSKKFTKEQIAAMKFSKVMISVILANLFIGFIVPPLNQALTRKVKHDRREKQLHNAQTQQNTSFKGGMNAMNAFTNIIENTNTGKLLSGDVGTTGGRMYNARRKEERREVAIRDIGSIYFYMWAMGHVGNLLNLIETGKATRLNPNTTNILHKRLIDYMDNSGKTEMSVEEFRKAVLGRQVADNEIPNEIKFEKSKLSTFDKWTKKKPLEVAYVDDVINTGKFNSETVKRIKEMSELQPKKVGKSVITRQQLIDAINKAEINDAKLLHNAFSEFTGGKGIKIEFAYVDDFINTGKFDSKTIKRIKELSELQSKKLGKSIITKQQLIDAINKAEINIPEFIEGEGIKKYTNPITWEKEISQTEFEGGNYNDEFKFVSNRKLYKLKAQMEQYVESICKLSKDGKVTKDLIEKAKNKNILYSGINFAAGFVVAATFLSTLIPKFQYYVTRKTTGMNVFPGTYDYVHHRETDG